MRSKILFICFLTISLIFLSGCVSQQVGSGLALSLFVDPPTIFGEGITTLYIDIDNKDTKTIENVGITAFDTGLLKYIATRDWSDPYRDVICQKLYKDLKPGQFDTFSCMLYTPRIELPNLQTDVSVKADFSTEFSVVQVAELMSLNEYTNRMSSGKFSPKPQSYSYRDKYVELQVDFSENLPVIVRPGKKYFVYFTIRNIGNGFISSIAPEDFYFEQQSDIIKCNAAANAGANGITYLINTALEPVGKEFPRLACEIALPPGINYIANYDMIIHLKYGYEIRDKITVNIVR